MALVSPTRGDWVAWVGTWEDIVNGREGQYPRASDGQQERVDSTYPASKCSRRHHRHDDVRALGRGQQPYIVSGAAAAAGSGCPGQAVPLVLMNVPFWYSRRRSPALPVCSSRWDRARRSLAQRFPAQIEKPGAVAARSYRDTAAIVREPQHAVGRSPVVHPGGERRLAIGHIRERCPSIRAGSSRTAPPSSRTSM